jgi:hypothetical protein
MNIGQPEISSVGRVRVLDTRGRKFESCIFDTLATFQVSVYTEYMPKSEKRKAKPAQKKQRKPQVKTSINTPDQLQEAKKIQAKARHKAEENALKVDRELNLKQEKFCQLYATDREFFGNGVQSYIEVYEPDQSKPNWYKTALACSARLLANAKVFDRINELLEKTGFNDAAVDKQTSFLIHQHADFTNKLGAIREYNKIKDRYPKQKIDVNHTFDTVEIESYGSGSKTEKKEA